MKKLLSLILALTMISSCLALAGCNVNRTLDQTLEEQIKRDYITEFNIENMNFDDVIIDYYAGSYNGYEVLMLDSEYHDPETRVEQIGESLITYYDSNQLYAYSNGKFYSLSFAYENCYISQQDINQIVYQYNNSISQFAFVADKYDFQIDEVECNVDEFYQKYDSYDYFTVFMDPKLSGDDVYLDKNFFGENIVRYTTRGPRTDSGYGCRGYSIWLWSESISFTRKAVEQLLTLPGVQKIEIGKGGYMESPSDPKYIENVQWGLDVIEIERVWDFYTGTAWINVGIIDTGIHTHQDIQSNLSDGKDFYNNSNSVNDDVIGHGTFIAGIIGAVGNNNIGISGVNWRINMIPLQNVNAADNAPFNQYYRYDAYKSASESAIEYATSTYSEDPIRILNASWGWDNAPESLREAIADYPGLLVCSAGNDGENLDEINYYPQVYDLSNMIIVGAIDKNDQRSIWSATQSSNYGTNTVDIYAPGSNVYSTYLDNGYFADGGTSYAAPYVTGVAALLLSINPDLTTAQLKDCILSGADMIDITVGDGSTQRVRRLNAWGSFMYMMQNYTPEIVVSQNTSQLALTTYRSSPYYLEKKPTAKVIVSFTEEFTFTLSGVGSSVDITLYDSEMNEIPITKTWQGNQWTVQFTKELTPGTYYVAGSYDNTTGGTTLNLSVSHEHTYSDWVSISETRHKECCECGVTGTTTGAHVTKASSIVNGKSYCIYCGYLVTLSGGFIPIIQNVAKISINGSYILPNGIIVLVDEDVEAYMNGTLVFYDKDKVPELQ